jgi:hypothetical protein
LSHKLFIEKVKLEPIKHKYYDVSGNEYMSVSHFIKQLSQPFEDTYAYRMADDATRAEWAKKRDDAANGGTRVHNALEDFSKTGQVKDSDKELQDSVRDIISMYNDYHSCHEEVCLYNEKYRIAGTTDKICVVSRTKTSAVDIADYKTNDTRGIEFFSRYNKRLFEPLSHLDDCSFVKYSIQLSLYAYFFEELTGRPVRRLYIHHVPLSDLKNHKIIPVMYMKNDVKALLDKYGSAIATQMTKETEEELTF